MRARGLPTPLVAEGIAWMNTRLMVPPLDSHEVAQIIQNVLRQPDRPRVANQIRYARMAVV